MDSNELEAFDKALKLYKEERELTTKLYKDIIEKGTWVF